MGKSPEQKAKATAWGWFSKYMRTKRCIEEMGDAKYGRCVTCGEVKEFKKLDCGHFVNGRSDAVLFEEDNVDTQCIGCNRFKSGQWVPFYHAQVTKLGLRRVNELMALYYTSKYADTKYTEAELREIADKYRLLYKELVKNNG